MHDEVVCCPISPERTRRSRAVFALQTGSRSERKTMKRPVVALALLAVVAVLSSSGCEGGQQRELVLASESALPPAVRTAPPVVREAYRFAIANPGALDQVPCYCGCGQMGHTSNRDCYVREFRPDGAPVFDNHALG